MRLNVRVVAATGRDPEALVKAGLLRQDLFHRLNAVRLHLPPVRERGEDVQFLLTHFLGIYAAKFRKQVLGFSEQALALLSASTTPATCASCATWWSTRPWSAPATWSCRSICPRRCASPRPQPRSSPARPFRPFHPARRASPPGKRRKGGAAMSKNILVTLYRNEVAPRFDLASEVLLVAVDADNRELRRQELVLAHSSADDLCDLILDREVAVVITGAVEEEHYHYLRWKRLEVIDGVAGLAEDALARHLRGELESGNILFPRGGDA